MLMKRYIPLTGLALLVCTLAPAQEATGERVVVPARNTTRPRVVNVNTSQGSITVKAYNGKEVIVENRSSGGSSGRERETSGGLRRIDLPPRGLSVEEEDNVVHIRSSGPNSGHIVVSVPADTSLHLRSSQGDITAEGIHVEVEANSSNGAVRLTGISGTVVASSSNGEIKVVMDRVDTGKPLSFSSNNGDVDVTLPADIKANVKLRSVHGSVWSDFDVKLTTGQPVTTTPGSTEGGKFRVQFDRTIFGTINGGGTEASFNTLNGRILIRKK
jgi:hypothetical protein